MDSEIKREIKELENIVDYQGNNPEKIFIKKEIIKILTNPNTKVGYKQDVLDDMVGYYSIPAINQIAKLLVTK